MIAKRRPLRVGDLDIRTPLLLPSFSSKGFPKVSKILRTMEEYIADELLVSAYDVYYGEIDPPFDFSSLIFLDSGGYEASKENELSETFEGEHIPRIWTYELYLQVVSQWRSLSPTIFVSYDHPKQRMLIADQIARAKEIPLPVGNHGRSLLIKPETEDSKRLHLDRITPSLRYASGFSVIGITEKEIGNSLLSRMLNVARLRVELDKVLPDIPIHVFGSLDTISTYLYYLAGADIFDGLTWLRYAFHDGDTIYRHSFGAMNLPITTNSDVVEGRCWSNNYQYMQEMRLNMIKFSVDGNFEHFGKHSSLIKRAYQSMSAELVGG